MRKIVLDTNVVVDYLMGRQPACDECKQLILMHAACQVAVCISSLSLKDAYFLVSMQLKRMERQASGRLDDASARAANEVAWACVRSLLESTLVLPVGRAEGLMALTFRNVHGDFEDDLIIAAAQSANADFLVTNDEDLLRHAPIACLSSADMLALLRGGEGVDR